MAVETSSNSPKLQAGPGTAAGRNALLLPLALTALFAALGFAAGARSNPRLAMSFGGVTAFLLCWQLWLFLLSPKTGLQFKWEFVAVPSHYIQAAVQFSIYAYWGWYWRQVYREAPLILSQLAFLYSFDALLTWSRRQTWRLGFGPWPIIFSTNLFMWFRDDWFIFQFLMVALGVLGKHFVRWKRNGVSTHIFNPSAFGLTIVSLILIFTRTNGYTWGEMIAVTQGYPPHPYTQIFLCGIVVQYFFGVTLLTFSAAVTLALLSMAYTHMTGVYVFADSNIPIAVFLGFHLLMTDPATSPRRDLGKIVFGALYGAGVVGAVLILYAIGAPGFYDKLVVVPVLNLLTPVLDRLAGMGWVGKFGKWEESAGLRKLNLVFMGGWVAVFLTMLTTGFVEAPHPGSTIAFWKKAAEENRPHAAQQLRYLLNQFDLRNFDDPSEKLIATGAKGSLSRDQILGILYNQVAMIYAEGKLAPWDPAKATRYFEKSCVLGNADGCANLAVEYSTTTNPAGAPTDLDGTMAALEQKAATSANGPLCYVIGLTYDTGRDRPQDKAHARALYERAAQLGNIPAVKRLALMQLRGEGGPPDHASAAVWLRKAAEAQDGPSCLCLALLYHNGDGVEQDEQKASALLQKACALGVSQACEMTKASHQ